MQRCWIALVRCRKCEVLQRNVGYHKENFRAVRSRTKTRQIVKKGQKGSKVQKGR